jgi:hypothetical protein
MFRTVFKQLNLFRNIFCSSFQIAQFFLDQDGNNIEEVTKLTKETNLLKIEDLLPLFNENIKIEHFKDEIC